MVQRKMKNERAASVFAPALQQGSVKFVPALKPLAVHSPHSATLLRRQNNNQRCVETRVCS